MAHVRKDTLTKPPEWWKHLRPYNKRRVAKKERRTAGRMIEEIRQERVAGQPTACNRGFRGA